MNPILFAFAIVSTPLSLVAWYFSLVNFSKARALFETSDRISREHNERLAKVKRILGEIQTKGLSANVTCPCGKQLDVQIPLSFSVQEGHTMPGSADQDPR